MNSPGTVYLIGAGPGDPGLITVRGKSLLERCDVVIYDRLTHPELLHAARPDAERIYVGKASAHHAMRQSEINQLLVERAREGQMVARLKGGDPFVFGRGGEEADFCRENGVPFEIVPGVTSAIAALAYAGIPVTHRDAASSFAVITGHERDDRSEAAERDPGQAEGRRSWAGLANGADTLVFLMGVEALPEIVARLIENGRSPQTPIALVQWGTWPSQRVVTGTLATIGEEVQRAGLTPPAVCVVGEVVRLRDRLRWFDDPETRPLFGRRVLVTRAREQLSQLSSLLIERGAEPIEFPTIRIQPRTDLGKLDQVIDSERVAIASGASHHSRLSSYDWVVFTSVNAVAIFAERLNHLGLDTRAFGAAKAAAIGPATAEALRAILHITADFVPSEAVAEAILEQWPDEKLRGKKILIPRASEARELLPEKLTEQGADVHVIPIYDTVLDGENAAQIKRQLTDGEVDLITFTSSSTVRNFIQALVGEDLQSLPALIGETVVAAIGPITAETAQEYGLNTQIIAEEHTISGLVSAMEAYYREGGSVRT